MDEPIGISAALHPFLAGRPAADRLAVERLEEELVVFLRQRGLPVDEEAGRRVALVPAGAIDPALAWAFVADHLITRVSEPVEELCRMGHLFAEALLDAARRGLIGDLVAAGAAAAALEAVQELPRLDGLARVLRAILGEGRPGTALYEIDPEAYVRAMQRWESQLPLAQEEIEGGFLVASVDERSVQLAHPRGDESIELVLPAAALRLVRAGDRIDMQIGRGRGGFFLIDVWAAAAPTAGTTAPEPGTTAP